MIFFLLVNKRYGVYYGCSSILRLTRIWANRGDMVFVRTIYGKGIFLPAALVPTAEEEEVKAIRRGKEENTLSLYPVFGSVADREGGPTDAVANVTG